jgi:hypothetical protein
VADRSFTDPAGAGFFLTAAGRDLTSELAAGCFHRLVRTAGIDRAGAGRSPARLGDLRHSFAVHTFCSADSVKITRISRILFV